MSKTYQGELEIDHERGVIYFHSSDPKVIAAAGTVSILRICRIDKPIPVDHAIDITHMHGVSFSNGST